MKYHLKHIDLFVQQYILPMPTIIDRFDDDFIQKLKSSFDIEFEKIRILIAESFYAYDEEKLSTRFIREHQRRITSIMNKMSEAQDPILDNSGNRGIICIRLKESLQELLTYMEQDFMYCMDSDQPITIAFGNRRANEFAKTIVGFNHHFCYSDTLIKIALEPIHVFIKEHKPNYSYSQVNYLTKLLSEIDRLHNMDIYGYRKDLVDILLCMNFNNDSFFKYMTDLITEDVMKREERNDRLQHLRWRLKTLRQKESKHDLALHPKQKNIKAKVVSWLEEEITYQESNPTGLTDPEMILSTDNKIQLSLSVDQLAFLVRFGKESKVILNQELKAVINLASKFISTKKQEKISAASLYNKVYELEINNPLQILTEIESVIRKHMYKINRK
jgi:hypothetical protein